MGFQVSPGVNVSEIDLTTIVPAVATTAAGMAGVFQWGPAEEITLVDSVNTLKRKFGGPDDENYQYFFTAANFLGYGNNLQVVRVVGSDSKKLPVFITGGFFLKINFADNQRDKVCRNFFNQTYRLTFQENHPKLGIVLNEIVLGLLLKGKLN